MRRGRAWKKRVRRTATASLPLWARIPCVYIWNNEPERAKDAICEWPLNLYVCRGGALWLAYHRTQTQSATQWEFLFNPSTEEEVAGQLDRLLAISRERRHSFCVCHAMFSVPYLVILWTFCNTKLSGTIYKGMLVKNKLSSKAMMPLCVLSLGSQICWRLCSQHPTYVSDLI